MPKRPIDFYFDFISPFGYFAARRIDDLAARHGRTVEWHSILLGVAILKVMGLKPLLKTPIKGNYLRVDSYRYARRHDIQFVLTEGTDLIDPLPPARAFQWAKAKDSEMGKTLALGLQEAYWGRGIDVAQPQNLIEVANGLGMDGKEILAGAESEEAKVLLRSDVDEGINRGVFGSPFILVDGEPFWGVEKLELLDEWLTEGGW